MNIDEFNLYGICIGQTYNNNIRILYMCVVQPRYSTADSSGHTIIATVTTNIIYDSSKTFAPCRRQHDRLYCYH